MAIISTRRIVIFTSMIIYHRKMERVNPKTLIYVMVLIFNARAKLPNCPSNTSRVTSFKIIDDLFLVQNKDTNILQKKLNYIIRN